MTTDNTKNPLGTSSEAIIESDFSVHANKEKSMEILMNMINQINSGGDVTPFIIGVKDGKPMVQELKVEEDGTLVLPKIKMNSRDEVASKSRAVRRILKQIAPILKAEIENVTYVALMRKDTDKLREIMSNLKKKKSNIKIENRIGCIWLIIDEFEFVI